MRSFRYDGVNASGSAVSLAVPFCKNTEPPKHRNTQRSGRYLEQDVVGAQVAVRDALGVDVRHALRGYVKEKRENPDKMHAAVPGSKHSRLHKLVESAAVAKLLQPQHAWSVSARFRRRVPRQRGHGANRKINR